MKKLAVAGLLAFMVSGAMAQSPVKPNTTPKPVQTTASSPILSFKNTLDSASYAFGFSMGSQLKSGGLNEVNLDILAQAIKHALKGEQPLLSEEDAQITIGNLFNAISAKIEAENKAKYATEIKIAEDFLAKNKIRPEVKTTASGLQYEVIQEGKGNKPDPLDAVSVHYKGALIDGTTFDSSYERGEPAEFHVTMVIKGWTEGLQLMTEGSKYKFYIPAELGYGAKGNGQIPPYSVLVFEVELLKIVADPE
ncbi:MAG: FKBP-type peptidyl-prolyl cis-trans isomerase [Pedobacter sp.]|nr:MAG: FKBP-type peptidyl-prolyl cis-trans isomerase [Pedobacter sp.]